MDTEASKLKPSTGTPMPPVLEDDKSEEEDQITVNKPVLPAASNSISTEENETKKKEIRPLFSRTSTTDKTTKQINPSKSMIVETETIDASNVPSVTLPIGSTSNVISNVISSDIMSTNSSISNNLSSLRTRKSTLFIEPNQTTISNNSQQIEDDNISVNGSIRNFNKRLNQTESHLNISKPGATKADLFAAKIANAVGDASDSDSEETFVYESAPDALNSTNTLPNKTISSLAANPALRKLSQRNISMPVSSSAHPYSPATASHIILTNEDSKEQDTTENESDSGSNNQQHPSSITTQPDKLYIMKSSLDLNSNQSNSTQNSNPSSTPNSNPNSTANTIINTKTKLFTKYHGDQGSKKPNAVTQTSQLLPKPSNNSNQLRTTTSKLFDVKGSSLRRYSGVPDDVNIEDYIDQYDEEQEIGGENISDPYDYDDYEDDDELTPLNINNANNNLRSKMNNHYYNRRSLSNFRSTDSGDTSQDLMNKDEHKKSRKYRTRPQNQARLQQVYSPHNFHNTKKNNRIQAFKNFIYFFSLVFLLLAFGFVAGFLLATTKDLQNVSIYSVDNIVTSYDELIFDLTVKAFNPGFVSVEIDDVELDIFAKSSFAGESVLPVFGSGSAIDVETVLLGTIVKFETPLEFRSGFFTRNYSLSRGEIKLLHPGQNITDPSDVDPNKKIENDSDKWKLILKHPFDLIIRGTFKYDLPFYHNERSVSVTKTVTIDPAKKLKTKIEADE